MKKFVIFIFLLATMLTSCGEQEYSLYEHSSESYYAPYTEAVTQEPTEPVLELEVSFENNNDYEALGISSQMNDVISTYFTRYFYALGSFEDLTMDDIFYFDTNYQRGIVNTMIKYQNAIRKDMHIDLSYTDATVGVTYKSITPTEEGIDIYLVQNDYMNYSFIPDKTSYTSDVEHHFVLRELDGEYTIVSHSEISSVYNLIVGRFDEYIKENNLTLSTMTAEQINSHLATLNNNLVSEVKSKLDKVIEQRDLYNSDPELHKTTLTADNPYNVADALEYSYQWVGKADHVRNPAFTEYDIYGGNCNNYTSQCLLAGGIPMDLTGEQWKWYGEQINNYGGRYGRSQSWAACEHFYNYCVKNTGFGLVADVGANLFSGRVGDIIQYVSDGIAVHSVIITEVIYDEEGNVVDYLINSNTTDKIDCPMSLYGYTDFRLIKIIGHNN